MAERVDGLAIRRRLGRRDWSVPDPYGPDGFAYNHRTELLRIIVTAGHAPDMAEGVWLHASISHGERTPTYEELVLLHRAVWGETGWAYQVFAPTADHVNIHPRALHLWGRPDGSPQLPNFGAFGTI